MMQTLTLSPAISDLLTQVASRLGQSPVMVAEEAVRHFIAHQEDVLAEKKRIWDAAVQVGLDDVAAGRVKPLTDEIFKNIEKRVLERLGNTDTDAAWLQTHV
jgi:predicted transcriptional regulator